MFILQGNGFTNKCIGDTDDPSEANVKLLMNFADGMLKQKSVESLPFKGKRKLPFSNGERLVWFAEQVVTENRLRHSRSIPTVVVKKVTPRNSITDVACIMP